MNGLQHKRILITGASSGIGRAIAIMAAKQGASLILTGRSEERLQGTKQLLRGTQHRTFPLDLSDDQRVLSQINQLVPEPLNGVVYCAGQAHIKPIKFLKPADVQRIYQINCIAPTILMSYLLKKKRICKQAAVVFISSIAAKQPYKGGSVYASTKAALESFSRSLALEYATQGIRANCIAPAMVKSPMYAQAQQVVSEQLMQEHAQQYPLGVGTSTDVAHAAVFLLSDAAKWITGQTLTLDGGWGLGK